VRRKETVLLCCISIILSLLLSIVLAACAPTAQQPGAPTTISPQIPAPTKQAPTTVVPETTKPAPAPSAEVIKLKMQTHQTNTSPEWRYVIQPFVDDVLAATGGRLEITPYALNTLVPGPDELKACATGMIDVGYSDTSYSKGIMPECELGTAPYMLRNLADAFEVYYYGGLREFMRESYAQQGVYLLVQMAGPEIPLISKVPINRVSDFVGRKIRTIGGRATMCDELGASTVYIPGDEVYSALASGAVEAATWGPEATFVDWGWQEVAKYVIYPALTTAGIGANEIFFNQSIWDGLSDDLKVILEISGETSFARLYHGLTHDSYLVRPIMDAAGVTRCYLPPEDYPALAKAASAVWDQIAEKSPRAKEAIKIVTDYMRMKGYTDYKVE